jgi:hypothetical protein
VIFKPSQLVPGITKNASMIKLLNEYRLGMEMLAVTVGPVLVWEDKTGAEIVGSDGAALRLTAVLENP